MKNKNWNTRGVVGYVLGLVALVLVVTRPPVAQGEDKVNPLTYGPFTFGGFVDTYYAQNLKNYDVLTRDYLTQPGRSREFNVNLADAEVKLDSDNFRGRLAGQVGTSVDINYAGEPERGVKYIQEAYLGYKLSDKLWLDGGIYFSHIGLENWLSRENWVYTRFLSSEFSPYYQEGAKLTYEYSPKLTLQLHVLNGWQNISDFNGRAALGGEVAYTFDGGESLTYNNYLGKESEGLRFFNDFVVKVPVTEKFELAGMFDVGNQERTDNSNDQWYAWGAVARYHVTDQVRLALRGEQYYDPDQVIISTLSGNGFKTFGASIGVDYEPIEKLLLRVEYRKFFAADPVFRTDSPDTFGKYDDFVVGSIAYSF